MDMPPPSDEVSGRTYHRGLRKLGRALAGAIVGIAFMYCVLRWKPFKVEVSGSSMAPTLEPGDWALAVKPGRLRRGHVVVLEHPSRPGFEVVKRIVCIPDELAPDGRILELNEWWVQGDNLDSSTDSRHFGPVTTEGIRARVRLIYWPPWRRRLL
jgi:nickel-type superoxide dismutase maturation protease